MILGSSVHKEHAEESEDDRVLVAVKYVGDLSVYNSDAIRSEGGFPGHTLQRGQWTLAMLQDPALSWWESHSAFQIAYSSERLSEVLLDFNYLPPSVFSDREYDENLRERVFKRLDIEAQPAGDDATDDYRAQLAETAGLPPDSEKAAVKSERSPEEKRRDDLMEYNRRELLAVAGYLDSAEVGDANTKTAIADAVMEADAPPRHVDWLLEEHRHGEAWPPEDDADAPDVDVTETDGDDTAGEA